MWYRRQAAAAPETTVWIEGVTPARRPFWIKVAKDNDKLAVSVVLKERPRLA